MASLANITFELRTILKFTAIAGGILLFIFIGVRTVFFLKNIFFPPPPTPAEQRFGELPPIIFPEDNQQASYVLDTVDGNFPQLPGLIEVYKTQEVEPNLIALEEGRAAVNKAKFTEFETKISDTLFSWSTKTGETITYDIYTKNFSIDSDFLYTPLSYVTGSFLLSKENLIQEIRDLLSELDVNTEDINFEESVVRYYKINSGTLSQVESQSEAQIARVDLFQNNVNDRSLLYPVYEGSTMNFYAGETDRNLRFTKATFAHHTVNIDESSTYPIISAEEAFEKLTSGQGLLLTDLEISPEKTLSVTDIGIAYYLGEEDSGYVYPVIVFVGNDFYAIVPGVRDN